MKKIVSTLLLIVFGLILTQPVSASDGEIEIRYVQSLLPEISVCIGVDGELQEEKLLLNLGTDKLNIQSVKKLGDDAREKVYVLLDLSTSMREEYFQAAVEGIRDMIDRSGENRSVTLVTFGAGEPQFYEEDQAGEILPALQASEEGTKINEAVEQTLARARDLPYGEYDLVYGIILSDGIEYSKGSTTFTEIQQALKTQPMAFYGICAEYSSGEDMTQFRSLAAQTGGSFYTYTPQTISQALKRAEQEAGDVYVVQASSASNHADRTQLTVKYQEDSSTIDIFPKSSVDETAPVIQGYHYDNERNVLVLTVSERLNTAGVESGGAVLVLNDKKEIVPERIRCESDTTLELSFGREIPNGNYTIRFQNITDNSDNRNALEDFSFELTESHSAPVAWILNYWYVLAALAVILLLLTVLLAVMKKKNIHSIRELFIALREERIHVKSEGGTPIQMFIENPQGDTKEMEVLLGKSKIFGRSSYCDVIFDDSKMSRQHFSIGLDSGKICIQDLGTTNGTYVNGNKITQMEVLQSGDRIFAGQTTITVEFQVKA